MSQTTAMMNTNPVLDAFNRHGLAKFLDDRRARDPKDATMGGMGAKLGKWMIRDEDYTDFLDLLYDYLFVQKQTPMNFVEQSRSDSAKPILIDLDFKYPANLNLTRKFTESHIKGFLNNVIDGLNTFFDLSRYEDGLRMFVTLRPAPYKDTKGNVKDGIHIECPDLCLSNEKQKALRSYLLEQQAVSGAFEGTEFNNNPDDIYDASMARKQGWFFYGESKPQIAPYALAHVFHYNPETEELISKSTRNYDDRELMELLSVRYNLIADNNEVKLDARELYNRMLQRKADTAAHPPVGGETVPQRPQTELEVIVKAMNLNSLRGCTPEDVPYIRRLVMECLSVTRAEDYGKWIEVGLCLHHIASTDEMNEKMFELWMDFSKKSSKAGGNNESQLKRDWDRWTRPSSERVLKFSSLERWAREDNPTKFKEILDDDVIQYIVEQIKNAHFHVAKVMQMMFGNQFRASIESKRTEWFTYVPDEHIWKHINQGITLRAKISNEVVVMFDRAKRSMKRQEQNADGDLSDTGKLKLKEFNAVEKSLYTAPFKDSVMKECSGLFYEEDFMNKLNLNPYLVVCKNGVLNLRAVRKNDDGKDEFFVEFRPGKPEDMMTFLAGREFGTSEAIDYSPLDRNDPRYTELMEFMEKLFPRPELKQYMITLLSSTLEGMNREQCYYTLQGKGGNGKSKILELMRMVLGDYQTGLAPTAMTRKRPDAGAANPDIIDIKNRRFIYLQEPDAKEPLNTSRMKQFSGEDIVEARGLFSDQEKFKISGKLFMLCNDLPPIHSMDRGTWRRIRLIPFESKFVGEGDNDYSDLVSGKPNVFPKDYFLDEKLKQWREVFLGLLVDTYQNVYCREGLREPAIVREASNNYKNMFDSYGKFRDAQIKVDPSVTEENRIDIKVIRNAFKNWISSQGLDEKLPSNQELKKRLEDDYGAPVNGKFKGIRIVGEEPI